MSTFLDLYTRFLDGLDGETRTEAQDLVTKMCGSPHGSDEHGGARRSLVRMLKSKAPHILPASWLSSPAVEDGVLPGQMSPEVDATLRKEWKGVLEDEGVFFWGRVPEWDELEKHFDGTDHRHPSTYHNDTPGSQKPHGNAIGVRHMVNRIITDHFHGDVEAAARFLGRPGTAFRDLVRFEGDNAYAERVRSLFGRVFGDSNLQDAAAEGTGTGGENFKLSAPVGSPQDAADVHQHAATHEHRAPHAAELVNPKGERLQELVSAGGELTALEQAMQGHLRQIGQDGRLKSVRGVVKYMDKQAAANARNRAAETRAANQLAQGQISFEQYLEVGKKYREDATDYIAAFRALQDRATNDPQFAALPEVKGFIARQERSVNKTTHQLAQVINAETRGRAPQHVKPAAPHPVGEAHGHPATEGEVPSHHVVPAEAARAARETKPNNVARLHVPGEQPPTEAPPAETVTTKPPTRLPVPAAAGERGTRLTPKPTAPVAPKPAAAPSAAQPEAPKALSTDEARSIVSREAANMGVELKPDAERKLVEHLQANPGVDHSEAFSDRLLGNEEKGIKPVRADSWKQAGAKPEAPKPAKPAPAPRPARPARTGGGLAPGQSIPGLHTQGLLRPGSNKPGSEVSYSAVPGSSAEARGGRPPTGMERVQDEVKRLHDLIAGPKPPKKLSVTPEQAKAELNAMMDKVKASYGKKDTKGVVDALRESQKKLGIGFGTGDWWTKIGNSLDAEFARVEGKGVKKSYRLPMPGDLPTRLPVPEDIPSRLPMG